MPNKSRLCICKCGGIAPLAKQTVVARGYVRGQPLDYIKNHHVKNARQPLADRFWPKVNKEGPLWNGTRCWIWTASINPDTGYGQIYAGHGPRGAHCVAYELLVGLIPAGLELDHLCRVRECVNPNHLEAVPHAINSQRGMAGRWIRRPKEATVWHQ